MKQFHLNDGSTEFFEKNVGGTELLRIFLRLKIPANIRFLHVPDIFHVIQSH